MLNSISACTDHSVTALAIYNWFLLAKYKHVSCSDEGWYYQSTSLSVAVLHFLSLPPTVNPTSHIPSLFCDFAKSISNIKQGLLFSSVHLLCHRKRCSLDILAMKWRWGARGWSRRHRMFFSSCDALPPFILMLTPELIPGAYMLCFPKLFFLVFHFVLF